ncbi:MAG: hypothetical protein NC084_00055 [Bacteroides sp.]|nr:hypothetical protein [Eubacterium sp.]MCM1417301.1 hypothetical protein [Roseburia sp.]MCM1461079.1 hypothetical protein [Bacteroides sp.]
MGDFFVDLFSGLVDWVLSLVNSVFSTVFGVFSIFIKSFGLNPSIPGTVFQVLDELTIGIGYILPISDLLPIAFFWVAFYIARIVFSIYHLIASTVFKRNKMKFK